MTLSERVGDTGLDGNDASDSLSTLYGDPRNAVSADFDAVLQALRVCPDLAQVIRAWVRLPDAVRTIIKKLFDEEK